MPLSCITVEARVCSVVAAAPRCSVLEKEGMSSEEDVRAAENVRKVRERESWERLKGPERASPGA